MYDGASLLKLPIKLVWFSTLQRAIALCHCEGNGRFDVWLAMHHRY